MWYDSTVNMYPLFLSLCVVSRSVHFLFVGVENQDLAVFITWMKFSTLDKLK